MEQEDAKQVDRPKAGRAGVFSIACGVVSLSLMSGAALLTWKASQECSMTALGTYPLVLACVGSAWVVALVGLPLGVRACCRGQVRAGTVGIILNVLLLVVPAAAVLVAQS